MEIRGELVPGQLAQLQAHLRSCARCAVAQRDAAACAGALLEVALPEVLEDPAGWERRLFLRLLGETEGGGAGGRRPAAWGRLALRLGRYEGRGVGERWRSWRRGEAEVGGSR